MSLARHLVVAYDIPDDRRRTKLANLLKGYLEHVQKSVFEGPLEDGQAERLLQAMERVVDRSEDSIRMYSMCRRCRGGTRIVGTGRIVTDDDDDIIL